MIAARAVAVGVALAAAGPAAAAPAVVAVVSGGADVRAAVLVGPSGELYEPDRQGAWARRSGGGVAIEVVGAVQAGDAVYAAGASTPMYRRRDGVWAAVRFGQRGRPLIGRGPLPSVAIGRQVFVLSRGKWIRVGEAPEGATALWAGGERNVAVIAAGAAWRLRGYAFARLPRPTGAVDVFGDQPWALAAAGAQHLDRGRAVAVATPGATVVAAAAVADTVWLLVAPASGPLVLERHGKTSENVPTDIPASTGLAGMIADAQGKVLIAARDGTIWIWADGAWAPGRVANALPAGPAGPAPAHTR